MQERSEYCEACKKNPAFSHTDCDSCEARSPEIAPENGDFFNLWNAVSTQWRVGMDGPIGLDYPAVFAVADLLNIDVTPAMLRKLRVIETSVIEKKPQGGGTDGK